MKDHFKFTANRLVITNVDIQSVEPVDQRTRDSLQKSVQLAIEITTNSQEASARLVTQIFNLFLSVTCYLLILYFTTIIHCGNCCLVIAFSQCKLIPLMQGSLILRR